MGVIIEDGLGLGPDGLGWSESALGSTGDVIKGRARVKSRDLREARARNRQERPWTGSGDGHVIMV